MLTSLVLLISSSLFAADQSPAFRCEFTSELISGSFTINTPPFINEYKGKYKNRNFLCSFESFKATLDNKKEQGDRYEIILNNLSCNTETKDLELPINAFLRIDRLRSGRGYAFFRPLENLDSLPCAMVNYTPKKLDLILFPPKVKTKSKKSSSIKKQKVITQKVKGKQSALKRLSRHRRH